MSASVINPFAMAEMLRVLRYKMEKNAARDADPTAVDRVKRNLFGSARPQENEAFLNSEMANLREAERHRWDFDFVEEKPVEGASAKLVWKRVGGKKPEKRSHQTKISEYMGKRKRAPDTILTDAKKEKIPKTTAD